MGIERSRQTGLPVTDIVKGEHLDAATYAKRNAAEDEQRTTLALCQKAFDIPCSAGDICLNIEEMTDKNDWIAVIHADGNGLGQVVQKIGGDKDSFREFSKKLDAATTAAAVNAFETIKGKYEWRLRIPIRPIVLGGRLGLVKPYCVSKYLFVFRKFFARAVKDGFLSKSPYDRFEVKCPSMRHRPPLTEVQLRMLEELTDEELSKIRQMTNMREILDQFLFSCYTGLRIRDSLSLLKSEVFRTVKGLVVQKETHKTGEAV